MSPTPLHDWLRPRLEALLAEALAAGFPREAVAAVLVDLATAEPPETMAPPSPEATPG